MRDEHHVRIGAQIARLREAQGWSQRALARWVGLDQSAVSRIEAGRRRLSAEELERFAGALHVSADALLKGPQAAPAVSLTPTAPFAPASPQSGGRIPRRDPMDREAVDPTRAFAATGEAPVRESRLLGQQSPGASGVLLLDTASGAAAPERCVSPRLAGLPVEATAVARDWFDLRLLAEAADPAQRLSTGHSADGRPESAVHSGAALRPGAPSGDVLYDRVARFWRSELHVDPDDGPLPDLVPLLEEGYGAQVIVARVAAPGDPRADAASASAEHPVAAAFTEHGVPFIFVNGARPVVLQRFALAHAFAHHVLGHGDIVDHRVEWSRNVPPEAAANDFAEEFLAPVRAVQRWYERRPARRTPTLEDLLDLGNTFGVSVWSALFRSRAAGRLHGKQFHVLRAEVRAQERELLPRQAFLGGLRDTLTHLTPEEVLPPGRFGAPAVLRVPAAMRGWALAALRGGRVSLEDAAALLRLDQAALARQLARLGLE
jgi:transcriptional regulator with XRE-family HTH domain